MLSLEEILPLYSQNTSCYERIWGRSEDVGIICSECGLAINCCSLGAGGEQGGSGASGGSPGEQSLVGLSWPGAGYSRRVERPNLFSSSTVIYWTNGASKRVFWKRLCPRAWKQFVKSTSSRLSFFYTSPDFKLVIFPRFGFQCSCRYQTSGAVNLCKDKPGRALLCLHHTRLWLAAVVFPDSPPSLHQCSPRLLRVAVTSTCHPIFILPKLQLNWGILPRSGNFSGQTVLVKAPFLGILHQKICPRLSATGVLH